MIRTRVIAPAVALFGALLVASACSSGSPGSVVAVQGDSPYRGIMLAEPRTMPNVVLTDTAGHAYDLRQDTRDKFTLVYVGYTHCPDICPAHMANIAAALGQLPPDVARDIEVLFVTSDPERDTPEVLRAWLDHFDSGFVGLTGSQDALDAVQRGLGLPIAVREDLGNGDYSVGHAADVVAFSKDGEAHLEFPPGSSPDDFAHDIQLLLKGWKTS